MTSFVEEEDGCCQEWENRKKLFRAGGESQKVYCGGAAELRHQSKSAKAEIGKFGKLHLTVEKLCLTFRYVKAGLIAREQLVII